MPVSPEYAVPGNVIYYPKLDGNVEIYFSIMVG